MKINNQVNESDYYNVEHPLYGTWQGMKTRCYNPNSINYKDYGGRGITICDEWKNSFKQFVTDMGLKPSSLHTLDRIDNDLNYNKDNCRWATPTEQANNTSRTLRIASPTTGELLTTLEISKLYNIPQSRVSERYRNGTPVEQGIINRTIYFKYEGKDYNLKELSGFFDVDIDVIRSRIVNGWTVKEAVETPVRELFQRYQVEDMSLTVPEISDMFNINNSSLIRYLKLGFSAVQAITYLTEGIVPFDLQKHVNRKLFSLNDKLYTINGLSKLSGTPTKTIAERICNGSSVEKATFDPVRTSNYYYFQGESLSVAEISRKTGLTFDAITYHIAKGFTAEDAVKNILNRKDKYHSLNPLSL